METKEQKTQSDQAIDDALGNYLPRELSSLIGSQFGRNPIEYFKNSYKRFKDESKGDESKTPDFNRRTFLNILKNYLVTDEAKDNAVKITDFDGTPVPNTKIKEFEPIDLDKLLIIVVHDDSAVYYISNDNWNKYKYNYLNISCYGPVKEIGDNWIMGSTAQMLQNTLFKSIDFNGLSCLSRIGDNWMMNCMNLNMVNFNGLSSLTNVGNNWIRNCSKLESVDFNGLLKLNEVGNDWMRLCIRLNNINFNELSNLTKVGNSWIESCAALVIINYIGLSSLERVGDRWMAHCRDLNDVNFNGLSKLSVIGFSWMTYCKYLINVDFSSFIKMPNVQPGLLSNCSNLETVFINSSFNETLKANINNENPGRPIKFVIKPMLGIGGFKKKINSKKKSVNKSKGKKKSDKKSNSKKKSDKKSKGKKKSHKKPSKK